MCVCEGKCVCVCAWVYVVRCVQVSLECIIVYAHTLGSVLSAAEQRGAQRRVVLRQ